MHRSQSARTEMRPSPAERGMALLMMLVLLTLLLGLVGTSIVALSRLDARVEIDERDRLTALYLADGGLESLKWELGQNADLGADGIGVHAVTGALGSTVASATLIAPRLYELDSLSTASGIAVQVRETALLLPPSMPDGALSVIGSADTFQLLTSSSSNFVADGGADSPAIVITDPGFHADFVDGIDAGISAGYVNATDLTGNGLTGSATIENGTSPADFSDFFTDIRSHVSTSIIPVATASSFPAGATVTWGTAAAPQTRRFAPGSLLVGGKTVNGFGTLVFNRGLVIESGATINWDGDLIVFGDTSNDAVFEIGGNLNVTGNVVLITGGSRNATFLLKSTGNVDVDGTLTAITNYDVGGTKLQFLVEGDFDLHGILTTGASIHQTEWKPGCDAYIEGLYQFAMPTNDSAQDVQFKIDDSLELVRDPDAFQAAIDGIGSIGSDMQLGSSAGGGELESYGWRIVY